VDVRTDGLAYLLRGKKKYTKMFANSYGEHAVESLMGVISSLHHNNPIPNTTIWLSELERKNAQNKLSFFEQKDRLLAVCVGDIRRTVKCWSADKFIELLNKQDDKFSGVIFLGGVLDKERTYEVASNIDLPYINTIGSSLLETGAFLENSILYVGPDSGVGHIACATKTPVVSFFSVDKPERCRPWGKSVICIKGSNNDARNILVEDANLAIREILNE
jgi:ADP-heptose:LPS heptosyltransferase